MFKSRARFFQRFVLENKPPIHFLRSKAGERLTCYRVSGPFEGSLESKRLVRHLHPLACPTGEVGDARFISTEITCAYATDEAGVAKMIPNVLSHTSHLQGVLTTDDQTPHFARLTGHAMQKLDMLVDRTDVVGDNLVAFADKVGAGLALSDLHVVRDFGMRERNFVQCDGRFPLPRRRDTALVF